MAGTVAVSPKDEFNIAQRKESNHCLNKNSCLIYWRIYFNFGFYFCVIPFRFKYNVFTGRLEKYENSIQKILVVLVNLIGFSATLARLRLFNFRMASNDPTYFVNIFPFTTDMLYNLTFMYVFWRRSSFFSAVFEDFQSSTASPRNISSKTTKRKTFIAVLICLLYAGLIPSRLTDFVILKNWQLDSIFDGMVKSYLGTENKISNLLIPPILLSKISFEIMMQYSELIIFFTIIGLYEFVSEFQSSLTDAAEPDKVLTSYRKLKNQSVKLNKAIWPLVMMFLISSLPFYVSALSQIFGGCASFVPLVYLIYTTVFLCSAASTNKNMDVLKDWVQTKCRDIDQTDLIVTLNDLTPRSTVGLTVGGLFPINYNFLGSLAGLLLTYIIVVVQMNMSAPTSVNVPCICNLSSSEIHNLG